MVGWQAHPLGYYLSEYNSRRRRHQGRRLMRPVRSRGLIPARMMLLRRSALFGSACKKRRRKLKLSERKRKAPQVVVQLEASLHRCSCLLDQWMAL